MMFDACLLISARCHCGSQQVRELWIRGAMSLTVVNTNLSSLKSCQTDVATAMDVVTDAAMDLAETEGAAAA